MRVVVDTNVWVSGLILPGTKPRQILDAVRDRRLEVVASWELAEEIADVLARPKLEPYGVTAEDIEEVLILLAPLLPRVDVRLALRDPDDSPVVESAIAGKADTIVTGDRDLLDDEDLVRWLGEHGVELLTPAQLLELL